VLGVIGPKEREEMGRKVGDQPKLAGNRKCEGSLGRKKGGKNSMEPGWEKSAKLGCISCISPRSKQGRRQME